jgi:hypothetical protein
MLHFLAGVLSDVVYFLSTPTDLKTLYTIVQNVVIKSLITREMTPLVTGRYDSYESS